MRPSQQPSKQRRAPLAGLILVLVCLLACAVLLYNKQAVIDWWRLKHYNAPPAITQLASDDTMTPYGRKVLYVNEPQIQAKATFTECNLSSEKAAVLGCYHSNQAGIFILQVSDPRLHGIEQVTAAHEMLHAAYDRLSSSKRQQVNGWLEDYYKNGLTDPVVKAQMAGYEKSEPNDVVNEMHSVFGTEVANLPASLEAYYQQYFASRATVVGYYTAYQSEFTGRQQTITADDQQLTTMKQQITTNQALLQQQSTALQASQMQLNTLRSTDVAAYNAGVPGYNAQVKSYNSLLTTIKQEIAQYNLLVDTRNQIALESQQLTNEISTQASSFVNK